MNETYTIKYLELKNLNKKPGKEELKETLQKEIEELKKQGAKFTKVFFNK